MAEHLKRDVRLEAFEFSLWSGIQLRGVEISEYPNWSAGRLLSAQSIALSPKWWPLLWGRIEIGSASVQQPRIHLLRTPSGQWNILEGFDQSNQASRGEQPPTVPGTGAPVWLPDGFGLVQPVFAQNNSSSSPQAGQVQLTLNDVELVDGKVHFEDQSKEQTFQVNFQRVFVSDFKLGQGGSVDVEQLSFNDSNLGGRFKVGLNPLDVRVKQAQISNFHVKPLLPYLSSYLPKSLTLNNGRIDSSVTQASYSPERIEFDGKVGIGEVNASYPPYDPLPFDDLTFDGSLNHQFSSGRTGLDVSKLTVDQADLTGRIKLALQPPWANPPVEGTIKLKQVAIQNLLQKARQIAPNSIPKGFEASGTLESTDLQLSRRLMDPRVTGTLELRDVRTTHPTIPRSINVRRASIDLQPRTLNLTANVPEFDGTLELTGQADDYQSTSDMKLDLTIQGRDLNLSSLLQAAREIPGLDLPPIQGTGRLPEVTVQLKGGLKDFDYRVKGTLQDGRLGGAPLPRTLAIAKADFDLNPGRATVSAQVQDFDGQINVDGTVENYRTPAKARADLKLNGSSINLEKLMVAVRDSKLVNLPDLKSEGTLRSVSGTISGALTNPQYNLKGSLENARISGPPIPAPVSITGADFQLNPDQASMNGTLSQFGGEIDLDGSITKYMKLPEAGLDLKFQGRSLQIGSLLETIRSTRFVDLPPLQASGTLKNVSGTIKGRLNKPNYQIEGTVVEARVESDRLPRPMDVREADFTVDPSTARFTARLRDFGGEITVQGTVKDYLQMGTAQLDVQANGGPFSAGKVLAFARSSQLVSIPPLEASGSIRSVSARVTGTVSKPDYTVDVGLDELSVQSTKLPGNLNRITGTVKYGGDRVQIENLKGAYENRPFQLSGRVPIPFDSNKSFHVEANVDKLPVQSILALVPGSPLPDGMDVKGLVSLKDGRVEGTLNELKAAGQLRASEGTVRHPRLKKPIEVLNADISIRNNQGTISSLKARYLERTIQGSGSFEVGSRRLNVKARSEEWPLDQLMASVNGLPDFPKNWKPGGNARVEANITGTVTEPTIQGTVHAPRLSLGAIRGEKGSVDFRYDHQRLEIASLRLGLFNGQLKGNSTLNIGSSADVRGNLNIESFGVGELLETFSSQGKPSRGNVNGTLSFSGALADPYHWDGSVDLGGKDWVLKETRFSDGLAKAFSLNPKGNSSSGLEDLIGAFLSRSEFSRSTGLSEIFSKEVTSRFQKMVGDIKFDRGRGNIRKLELVNDDVRLTGGGTMQLKGDLNLKLRIEAREPLLKKVKKDWLRQALKSGLPPIQITGTYFAPEFQYGKFTRELTSNLLKQRTLSSNGTSEDKRKKDPVKDLLKQIFD